MRRNTTRKTVARLLPLLACALLAPASTAGPGGGDAGEEGAAAQAELVTRTYDVRRLFRETDGGNSYWRLLPGAVHDWYWEGDELEHDVPIDCDGVAELVRELAPDEFDYEGRFIAVSGDEELHVRASAEVQERVARLLAFLRGVAGSHVELRLDFVSLSRSDSAALGGASFVTEAEAQRLIDSAPKGASSHLMRFWPRLEASTTEGRVVDLVADYDVEIAHGSFIHDPVLSWVHLGTQVHGRAWPAQGGVDFTLLVERTSAEDGPQDRKYASAGLIGGEETAREYRGPERLQGIEVLTRSFAWNGHVPEGRAALLRSSYSGSGGARVELAVLRRVGPRPAAVHTMRDETTRRGLAFLDVDACAPPRLVLEGPFAERRPFLPRLDRMHPRDDEPLLYGYFDCYEPDLYFETLSQRDPEVEVSVDGPWMIVRTGPREGGEDGRVDPVRLQAELQRPTRLVDLALTLRKDGRPIASTELALRAGTSNAVLLGTEGFTTPDVDVEVAQTAAASDPVTVVYFEGLALLLQPTLDETGGVVLDLRAAASPSDGQDEFDPRGPLLGALEQRRRDALVLEERLVFGTTSGSVVLGDASGAGLSLEVVLRR